MGKRYPAARTALCRARPQVEWLEDRRVLSTLRMAPATPSADAFTPQPTALAEATRTEEATPSALTVESTEATAVSDAEPARTSETAPRSTDQADPPPPTSPSSPTTFTAQKADADAFEPQPTGAAPREPDSDVVRPEDTEPTATKTTTFSTAGPISPKTTAADPAEPTASEPRPRQAEPSPPSAAEPIDAADPVKAGDRVDAADPVDRVDPVDAAPRQEAVSGLTAPPAEARQGSDVPNEPVSGSGNPEASDGLAVAPAPAAEVRDQGGLAGEAAPGDVGAEVAALAESAAALDAAPLTAALGAFLDGLEDLGRQIAQAPREIGLPFWLVAAALATGACEVGRRQLRRGAALPPTPHDADPLRWTLGLPEA
jgi:hypothetical protein